MKKRGISLMVLIVVIIVIIILAGSVILTLLDVGVLDSAKKARFFNDLSSIEDGAKLKATIQYSNGKAVEEIIDNFGEVTNEEKDYILENIPTLDESIKLVNDGKDMYQSKLYWLDAEKLGITGGDKNTKYLIDMDTLIPYDYEGKGFEDKTWHTIRYGVGNGDPDTEIGEDTGSTGGLPAGWMRLVLHYPEDSIDRQWRLSIPGETRDNSSEDWKFYTGPILLKIENIPYVLIRYSINGEEITLSKTGKVVVDISATPKLLDDKVTVTIKYDAGCINKHYKVGQSGWKVYTGPFEVTEDVLIQARADKEVEVKDTQGNVIGTTLLSGQDKYQIQKAPEKLEPDESLAAPTINKLDGIEPEKARITIDYPTNLENIRKIYKLNSGAEIEYIGEFPILEYGTEITAYYYTSDNKLSPSAKLTIDDDTKLDVKIFVDPNPEVNNSIFETKVAIEYDERAISKTYKIDDGAEKPYTGTITVSETCVITAYARKDAVQATDVKTIKFDELKKPEITYVLSKDKKKATVSIRYDSVNATEKIYNIDGGESINYTTSFDVTKNGTVIYAMNKNAKGDIKDVTKTIVGIEGISAPEITETPNANKTKAIISIKYDTNSVTKQYSIDGGALQNYTAPFEVTENGTVIYAINKDSENNENESTLTVTCIQGITSPKITGQLSSDQTKSTITIEYDENAVTKQYSIDGGALQNYTAPFEVTENGTIIYAINTDVKGESKDTTYTVSGIKTIEAPKITGQLSSDQTKSTITIEYDTNAVTKQYSIDGGALQNYTVPFEVTENGTIIYAINTNSKGESKDATYTVSGLASIAKPIITGQLSSDKTKSTITIEYDTNAVTKQYSIGGGALQNYTGSFEVTDNGTVIYAINTDAKGESKDASYIVKGIEAITSPKITGQLSSDKAKSTITIIYDVNAVTKQYSINGGALQNYTAPFEVTENGTVIYAINTDAKGESKDATYTVSGITHELEVAILVNPDTTEEVASVNVTINYDTRATLKQYSINGGTLQNYTSAFNVTESSTIKAVASYTNGNDVGYGEATKKIDNLPTGVAAPIFNVVKNIETEGEYATVTIQFDKKSVSNTYCINDQPLQTYTGPIQIRENDTVITAYNVDSFGNSASAQEAITGLIRYLLIDKDKYYHIVLPYPANTIDHEYRYTQLNPWKAYPDDGFILVKSQYEAELTAGGKLVKLEVTPGNYVDFDGHWYIVDENFLNLEEDIDMRWGYGNNSNVPRVPLQIIPSTKEPTDKVDIFIVYPSTAISKQYKINNGTYQNYTNKLTITENNTTIYAKTQYADGTWSVEKSYLVSNIVSQIPDGIITMTPNITAWTTQNVLVDMVFEPHSEQLKKKYKTVINGVDSGWNYITENSKQITMTENGTIFAAFENNVGESSEAVTLNITNIDKTPPTVTYGINGSTSGTANVTVTVSDAGSGVNNSTLQYVWDTQNTTAPSSGWVTFTNGQTFTKMGEQIYYLWIKASDNLGNSVNSVSNPFSLVANKYNFNYTGGSQTFTASYSGTYRFEVWGARGGNDGQSTGGYGGYSSGFITLSAGQTIYVYVGGKANDIPENGSATATGGWNGGGRGGTSNAWRYGSGGGGATDIRISGTALTNRVIVAGGGGGADANDYTSGAGGYSINGLAQRGGNGGGLNATIGNQGYNKDKVIDSGYAKQTSGYSLGVGQSGGTNAPGGGGGYYGGKCGDACVSNTSGGSGYIGGVTNGSTQVGVNNGNGYAIITGY